MHSAATAAGTIVAIGAYLSLAAALGLSAAPIGVGLLVIALVGALTSLLGSGPRSGAATP